MSDHTFDRVGKGENTLQADTKLIIFLYEIVLTSVFLGSQGTMKELLIFHS